MYADAADHQRIEAVSARGKLEQMERLFRGAEVPAVHYPAQWRSSIRASAT